MTLVDDYVRDKLLEAVDGQSLNSEAEAVREALSILDGESVGLEMDIAELRDRFADREVIASDYYRTLDALRRRLRATTGRHDKQMRRYVDLTREGAAPEQWDDWNVDQRRSFIKSRLAAVILNPAKQRGRAVAAILGGEVELLPR